MLKKVHLLSLALLAGSLISHAQTGCSVINTIPGSACYGSDGSVEATPSTGSAIRWYDQSTGGNLLYTGNKYTVNNVTTSSTYYAEAFSGGILVPDTITGGLYATNNNNGCFWDVKALNTVTLTDVSWRAASTGAYEVDLYMKSGTAVGSESNASAWTKIGSMSVNASSGGQYKINLTTPQVMTQGQTYGFYIIRTNTPSVYIYYHTATTPGAGNVWHQNSDLQLIVGGGAAGVFTGVSNASRMFDGILWYEVGSSCTSPREAVSLSVVDITKIEKQSIVDTGCIGVDMALYVKAKGNIYNYNWQIYNKVTNSYDNITTNPFVLNNDTLNIVGTPDTLDGAQFRCTAMGQCGTDMSQIMRLVIDPLPSIVKAPEDQNLVPGDVAEFSVTASSSKLRYQWQVASPDTFVNINDGGIYTGTRTNKLKVLGVSRVQDQFKFRCVIFGTGNCAVAPDTSNYGVLYVEPAASVTNVPADQQLTLYPNPATSSYIYIKAPSNNLFKNAAYNVSDKMGRLVATGTLSNNNQSAISVADLPTGVYTIHISATADGQYQILRFTKL